MRSVRPLRRAAGLAAVTVVFTATGAFAHPFVTDGATVPAASLTTMTLEMGHGCGDETGGGGDPTLEVAMEVPDQVSYIDPLDTDGYTASVEANADGRPEVVVWTATDGGVAAPAVPMDLVIDGEEGDALFLKVFQGCGDFEYRWVGTPEDPADDPAVSLTLGPVDPDAPAPPTEEPAPSPADEGANESSDQAVSGDAADVEPEDSEPPDDDTRDATKANGPAGSGASDEDLTAAASADDDGGVESLLWIGIALLLVVVIAALIAAQNRRRAHGDTGSNT